MIGEQEVWGKSMWMDLSQWAQNVDICVPCDRSLRTHCYDKVDKIESDDVSQPFSPAAAVVTQWAPGHSDKDGTSAQHRPPRH